MKPRIRVLIEQCVEEGTLLGYRRAHKHTDDPGEDAIAEMITNAIMGRLYEWFEFDESE
jgi:hypothetical protein